MLTFARIEHFPLNNTPESAMIFEIFTLKHSYAPGMNFLMSIFSHRKSKQIVFYSESRISWSGYFEKFQTLFGVKSVWVKWKIKALNAEPSDKWTLYTSERMVVKCLVRLTIAKYFLKVANRYICQQFQSS